MGTGVSRSLYFVRERMGPEGVFTLFWLSRKTWGNIPSSARLSLSPKGQAEMTADRISGLLTLNVSEEMILQT